MYNRQKVYEYAKKWAYGRNPKYYNFDPVGGDCTNFVSQCIYSGCGQMNYNGATFLHSLIVVQNGTNTDNTLIAAHTYDIFGKSVAEYGFEKYRCINIET